MTSLSAIIADAKARATREANKTAPDGCTCQKDDPCPWCVEFWKRMFDQGAA